MATLRLLLSLLLFLLSVHGQDNGPTFGEDAGYDMTEIRQAAIDAVAQHRSKLEEKRFFYQLPEELDLGTPTLGRGIPLYLLEPETFENLGAETAGGEDLGRYSRFTETWIFPVNFGGEPGLVQWIAKSKDGGFAPGAFGMRPLALKIRKIQKVNNSEKDSVVLYTIPRFPRFYYTLKGALR